MNLAQFGITLEYPVPSADYDESSLNHSTTSHISSGSKTLILENHQTASEIAMSRRGSALSRGE